MKRYYFIMLLINILLIPSAFAHEDMIVDEKNKKSLKVSICDEINYGFHAEEENYHFHQIIWNEDENRWTIIDPTIVFDRNPCSLKEGTKFPVKYSSCVDGDTVKLDLNNEIISVRLLAVDTPELNSANKDIKNIAIMAKDYLCNTLNSSKYIFIEYDEKSSKLDKYGRHLVWIFNDQGLIQETLINNGYAKVAYLYGKYKYVPDLQILEEKAAKSKIGIWAYAVDEASEKTASSRPELTEEEKLEKIIYILLVIIFSIIAIVKEITKK